MLKKNINNIKIYKKQKNILQLSTFLNSNSKNQEKIDKFNLIKEYEDFENKTNKNNKINLFITWKNNDLDFEQNKILNQWIKLNPNININYFDDLNINKWMKDNTNFEEISLYHIFNSINSNAAKIDLWRYCILYQQGGIYCDFDCLCLNKLSFLDDNFYLVIPNDYFGFFQGFIYSPKKKKYNFKKMH